MVRLCSEVWCICRLVVLKRFKTLSRGSSSYIVFVSLDCFWLLNEMLQFTAHNDLSSAFAEFKGNTVESPETSILPQRMEGSLLMLNDYF